MEYEVIIGLELHIEMKTKSKMFSSAPVTFGDEPNVHVAPLDMGFPGTLPVVNKQAVINAIRVCHALHMSIDNELWFDRKNYFYSDLPKGYQITQDKRPIGKDGFIEINNRRIGIERLHLEEDTCKQLHYNDFTLLDYNRAGIPLIEIVSKPEIRNGEEAMKYVEKIRSIVCFLDVSDGKMQEGSLRCDVNVSIKEKGSAAFGTKVEIKNINTLNNIKRAIDFEIDRQISLISSGERVIQETRRYDEDKKQTVPMRLKIDSVDYKCYTDANIIPIKLSDEFIDNAIKSSPELAEVKYARYLKLGLSEYDASLLISDKSISEYFDQLIRLGINPKLSANWINVDIKAYLNDNKIDINSFPIDSNRLAELIILIEKGKLSNKQAREVFQVMLTSNDNPETIMDKLNITVIDSEEEITKIIIELIQENPNIVLDYRKASDKVVKYLVGQVMKKTHGKANPSLTNKLVIEELKRR